MKLHEKKYINFVDNKKTITSFDIVSELLNCESDIYKHIEFDLISYHKKELDENKVINYFIELVVVKWGNMFIKELSNIAPYLFTNYIEIRIVENILFTVLSKYIENNEKIPSKEQLESEIIQKLYENDEIFNYLIDIEDNNYSYFLSEIGLQNILKYIKYNFEDYVCITDNIDMELKDTYLTNCTIDIDNFVFDNIEIPLNLFPKQDGNDEGCKLGKYLDYLGAKIDKDYKEYYIHNKEYNIFDNIPMSLKWLLESQGYNVNSLFIDEKVNNSKFLKSLREEIVGEENSCQFMVFLVKMTVREFIEIYNKNKKFTIPKNTVCGFMNCVHGSTNGLDIELEKDIVLNFDFKKELCTSEYCELPFQYGYSLADIWCQDSRYLYRNIKMV